MQMSLGKDDEHYELVVQAQSLLSNGHTVRGR